MYLLLTFIMVVTSGKSKKQAKTTGRKSPVQRKPTAVKAAPVMTTPPASLKSTDLNSPPDCSADLKSPPASLSAVKSPASSPAWYSAPSCFSTSSSFGMATISPEKVANYFGGADDTSVSLQDFGIKPGLDAKKRSSAFYDKNSLLKCCLIHGPETSYIVFRFEPVDKNGGSWSEKCFHDALYKNLPWVIKLNFQSKALAWFHDNEEQKNDKGYAIHLFVIPTGSGLPPKQHLLDLGKHVCNMVNRMPKNNTTAMVDEHSFFWLPDDAVWSDIIGCEAALNALLDETDLAITDYYKTYEDTIHSYFHHSSFDCQLASILRAPPCELHPSVMYEEELSGEMNDADDGIDGGAYYNVRNGNDEDEDD